MMPTALPIFLGKLPQPEAPAKPALPPGWITPGRFRATPPPKQRREVLPERMTVTPEGMYDENDQEITPPPTNLQGQFNGRYKNTDQTFAPEETDRLLASMKANGGSQLQELDPLSKDPFEIKYDPLQPGQEGKLTRDFTFKPGRNRARIQDEQDFQDLQIQQAKDATQRHQEALAQEAVEKARQAKIAEMEAIMEFQRKYGVSPDSPIAPTLIKAEEERAIDEDQKRAENLVKRMLATGQLDDEGYKENMRAIGIYFGMKRHAPGDWAKAVAPPQDLFAGLGGS